MHPKPASHASSEAIEQTLRRAFAPLPKLRVGVATGLFLALVVFALTALAIVTSRRDGFALDTFSEYLYGYEVSWRGAAFGAWWSFVAGFVAGWFVAFVRNFTLATWLFIVRTKADLAQTTDFLDHI